MTGVEIRRDLLSEWGVGDGRYALCEVCGRRAISWRAKVNDEASQLSIARRDRRRGKKRKKGNVVYTHVQVHVHVHVPTHIKVLSRMGGK